MKTFNPSSLKQIAFLGLARSGLSTAQALLKEGKEIVAWDDNLMSQELGRERGIPIVSWLDLEPEKIEKVVVSPGIPLNFPLPHPMVSWARAHHIELTGDLDVFYEAHPVNHYIGITGTNGKSTTTALVGHILKQSLKEVAVGGNIGISAFDLSPLSETGTYVFEVSSYQLDLINKLKFEIALLLNLTPDHLDRHGGMEGYIQAKAHIFDQLTETGKAVISMDDPYCLKISDALKEKGLDVIAFSLKHRVSRGISFVEGVLFDDLEGFDEEGIVLEKFFHLKGSHNFQNAIAAYAIARLLKMPKEDILKAFQSFKGLEHRQEVCGKLEGVTYINDSKATSFEAATKALSCFDSIYWILGGKNKQGEEDLKVFEAYFPKIKHVFLIGESLDLFAASLEGTLLPFTKSYDLKTALDQATGLALQEEKAVILLSPACASFDQFKDFEDRGHTFKKFVKEIMGRQEED